MPDAEYLYACDRRWWDHHIEDVRRLFKGRLFTQWHTPKLKEYAAIQGLESVEGRGYPGLGRGCIHHGGNSGYQAINLAYLLGATRIYLLGYDMGRTGGRHHWFGNHPAGMANSDPACFVEAFDRLALDLAAEGVEVINLSRQTNLTQFKRSTVDNEY